MPNGIILAILALVLLFAAAISTSLYLVLFREHKMVEIPDGEYTDKKILVLGNVLTTSIKKASNSQRVFLYTFDPIYTLYLRSYFIFRPKVKVITNLGSRSLKKSDIDIILNLHKDYDNQNINPRLDELRAE